MFDQNLATRIILSIKRVKEPRFAFKIRWTSRGGATTLVVTLFSWRVRVGERVLPLLWTLVTFVAGILGYRGLLP
jgi:hypothetical protein